MEPNRVEETPKKWVRANISRNLIGSTENPFPEKEKEIREVPRELSKNKSFIEFKTANNEGTWKAVSPSQINNKVNRSVSVQTFQTKSSISSPFNSSPSSPSRTIKEDSVILKILVPALEGIKIKKFPKNTKLGVVIQKLNSLLPPQSQSNLYFLFCNNNKLDSEQTIEYYNLNDMDTLELKREAKYEIAFKENSKHLQNILIDETLKTTIAVKLIGEWVFQNLASTKMVLGYKLFKLIPGGTLRQEFGDLKEFSQYVLKNKDELELAIQYTDGTQEITSLIVKYSPLTKVTTELNSKQPEIQNSGTIIDKLKNWKITKKDDNYSMPYNVKHNQHVDFNFTWVGQKPDELFEIGEQLGIGAYATVYLATHKQTGYVLAVKKVKMNQTGNNVLTKEIEVLKKCKSPNILSYFGTCSLDNEVWILMDYCAGGSVKDVINLTLEVLDENQIAEVLVNTLKGLVYLHQQNIIHLDMKAGNIMLTEDAQVKIGDFGVSEQLRREAEGTIFNNLVGSPLFMAPEVIKRDSIITVRADIWSLGITLIEMAEGRPPNNDINSIEMLNDLPNRPPPTLKKPRMYSSEFNEFIAKCLVKDPKLRPPAADLFCEPFVQNTKGSAILLPMIRQYLEIKRSSSSSSSSSNQEEIF